MRLTKTVKRWVHALRFGRYTKATGFLHEDDRMCVLGVGLDVLGRKWHRDLDLPSYVVGIDTDGRRRHFRSSAPPAALRELGLSSDDQSELIALNDADELSFAELADVIEFAAKEGTSIRKAIDVLGVKE